MTEPLITGRETAVHSAASMEGFVIVNPRAMIDFCRVTARIEEFDKIQHHTLFALCCIGLPKIDSGFLEIAFDLVKFFRACNSPASVVQVIAPRIMNHDPMVLIIEAQIESIFVALLEHLQTHDVRGIFPPRVHVADADSDIT
jgi:hypothetical protein